MNFNWTDYVPILWIVASILAGAFLLAGICRG